jgi:hypothetical protein
VYDLRLPWVHRSARLDQPLFGLLLVAYHDGCIEQNMPHCGHILQHHGNPERSDYFERSVEVIVLWQCDEVLQTSISHRAGLGEGLILTLL